MLVTADDLVNISEALSELDHTILKVTGTVAIGKQSMSITFDPDKDCHVITIGK